MKRMAWMRIAPVALLGLLCSVAAGSTFDGDFSGGETGWFLNPFVDSSDHAAEIVGSYAGSDNVLHLKATAEYEWENTYWERTSSSSMTSATAAPLANPAVPVGNDYITFWAAGLYSDDANPVSEPTDDGVKATVQVTYFDTSFNLQTVGAVINGGWSQYSLYLPGIDHTMSIGLLFEANAELSLAEETENPDNAETQTIWAEAYIDNIAFTPEPATVVLLGLGGAALLRRRRR